MRTATMNDVSTDESVDTDRIDLENDADDLGKEDQKSWFVHLRAKGFSLAKIAKELKVSKSTLTNWSGELQEQIAQARAMELETLQEEFFLLKEGRIRLFGEQLKDNILKDARGEEWLRAKVQSLQYDDGFSFREIIRDN